MSDTPVRRVRIFVSAPNDVAPERGRVQCPSSHLRTSPITVDDIEVAQFIYLMLNYQKVRNVLQTFRNSRASNSTVLKPQVDAVWTRCAVPPRPSGSRSGL